MGELRQQPKCQRCQAITEGKYCLVMSYFNQQMLCEQCERDEQENPYYKKARQAELKAIKAGNYNFKGIGCYYLKKGQTDSLNSKT